MGANAAPEVGSSLVILCSSRKQRHREGEEVNPSHAEVNSKNLEVDLGHAAVSKSALIACM